MKILILDTNVDYTKRLKYYFEKKYSSFQLYICDNFEAVQKLREEEKFDIVLFDSAFDDIEDEKLAAIKEHSAFAYLSSTNEIVNDQDTIYKYRGISVLYDRVCKLYEKKTNRVILSDKSGDGLEEDDEGTKIITFLPVHGGAGSSTMAAAYAVKLAKDHSVLYINLEQRPSDSVFFNNPDNKKSLTDIIALLKTKYTDSVVYKLLKDVISEDTRQGYSKVSFIKGYKNIMDCCSMTEQCLSVMLKVLREKFNYKYIIIDSDYIVGPILQKTITLSDKLVFVISGSDLSSIKMNQIRRYLDVIKRDAEEDMPENYILFNQYYGMENEAEVSRDMKVLGRLARYRTDDKSRITSQKIIDVLVERDDIFQALN
ncbi:MAG: AAA family ATPase [Ruminococcus sp.]|nr:AAA family ATPase [Ruminococcus sp.]